MATKTTTYVPRLKTDYNDKYVAELKKELNISNVHQVPVLKKIVLNVGLGRAMDDKKLMEIATNTITKITGQHPVQTSAKKSIAGFNSEKVIRLALK